MTDDEIIMLWTLAGSPLGYMIPRFFHYEAERYIFLYPEYLQLCQNRCLSISKTIKDLYYLRIWNPNFGVDYGTLLYEIKDYLTFVPTERWLKLLLAKHWYSKNKEQFE